MLCSFKRFGLCWLTTVFFAGWAHAQTTVGAVGLRAEAQPDAKVVQKLADKAAVKVLKRQGFWVEVEASGVKGWLKVSEISLGSGATGATGLGGLDTGRTGKGNIVSTTAARGLTVKELVAAKPDPKQVTQLKGLAVSASAADAFAKAGGLAVRQVALLSGVSNDSDATSVPTASKAEKPALSKASSAKRVKPADDDEGDDDE
jgi:uncharacterized protein YgiM (DUF1202 family)